MEITMSDGVMYVFTLGVMVNGVWIADPGQTIPRNAIALAAVFSLFWTGYFKWSVGPKFVDLETEDEEDEEEGGGSQPTH